MKKSLFKKYLSVTSIIIVVSFLFLGTVMIVFIARYFQSEKQAQLTQNAKSMASIAGQSVVMMQDNQYLLDGSRMALFIKAFSDNVDADFFLVDQSGAEMLSTYSIEEDENPNADIKSRQNISAETMQQALSGYFSATGTMNGLYESNYYIIGVPIVTTNSSGQQVAIGAVFAASDLKVLDVFIGCYCGIYGVVLYCLDILVQIGKATARNGNCSQTFWRRRFFCSCSGWKSR